MAFSLDELTTPLTRQEVEAKIYAVLATRGVTTTAWKPGSVVRTMITASAMVMAAFSELAADVARAGFAETSRGGWLTLVARYGRNVERIAATFAEGEITLTNTGGGIYVLEVDDLVFANAESGKQYRNSESVTLGALETVTVGIRATEAGAASTSAPGEITELVTPLLGVTCTNAAPVVGADEETDAELRARYDEKLGSLSPMGPWDAYTYAAKMATREGGSRVGVTRVRTVPDSYGRLTVYVATASGAVSGAAADAGTDLGAVNEAIQQRAAPLAITADVVSATPVAVPVTYKAWMLNTSGLTPTGITETVEDRLVAFFAEQPIGGNRIGVGGALFHDAIRTVIGSALPQIFHVELTVPLADVSLSAGQVAVLGTVTATSIIQVSPSEGGA